MGKKRNAIKVKKVIYLFTIFIFLLNIFLFKSMFTIVKKLIYIDNKKM